MTLLYASVHLGLPLLTLETLNKVSYERVRKVLKELFKLIVKEIITIRNPKLTEFIIKAATLLVTLEKSIKRLERSSKPNNIERTTQNQGSDLRIHTS